MSEGGEGKSFKYEVIRDFSSLEFDLKQANNLVPLAEKVCRSLRVAADGQKTMQDLLFFQQLMLEQQSAQALLRVQWVLNPQDSPDQDLLAEMLKAEAQIAQAKQAIYKEISHFSFEDMQNSPEDIDLWSRAWRWKKFEYPVQDDLFLEEQSIMKALKRLSPTFSVISKDYFDPRIAFDSRPAMPQRFEALSHFLQYLSESSGLRQELALDLIKLRQEIARQAGFACYSDYHEARRGKRSFSRRQERLFVKNFKKTFDPIYEKLQAQREERWSERLNGFEHMFLIAPQGQVKNNLNPEESAQQFGQVIRKIIGQKSHFLYTLLEKGYVSFTSEVRARLDSACTLFLAVPAAFLAFKLSSPYDSVVELFFDCGYALADISAMLNYHALGSSNQDSFSKQLAAYSFAFLSYDHLPEFYGANASHAFDYACYREAYKSLVNLAAYSFEDKLYTLGGPWSNTRARSCFQASLAEFVPQSNISKAAPDFFDLLWPYFLAQYTDAYTSLAQVMAMVAILSEHPQRLSKSLLSSKFNTYLVTNPGSSIAERLQSSNLNNPVNSVTLDKAAFAFCDVLSL